jgi:hypothetical protein
MNARPNIPGVLATSPQAIERAAQAWSDAKLNAHLDAQDVCEANDRAARRHLNDTHIAEAVAMVQENVQDRIEDGRIPKELGDMLLALFERIEAVAIEASWADLAREACDD